MGATDLPAAGPMRERPGRDKGSTAFYAFAEHLRLLSGGRVNHKVLYSLLGTNGYYVNHKNPSIRKRTAASLSRLVHSSRYVADFQQRGEDDPGVFVSAADAIVDRLLEMGHDTDDLYRAFRDVVWPAVEGGLAREHAQGRNDLSPQRIVSEMEVLFSALDMRPDDARGSKVRHMVTAILQVMVFGHLEAEFAHSLYSETPLAGDARMLALDVVEERQDRACLVRLSSLTSAMLGDFWYVRADAPFVIGRFADCDAIERDAAASRRHCSIARAGGSWVLSDLGSRNGTRVYRAGELVFDSAETTASTFILAHDDTIVLAGRVRYWFGLFGTERPAADARDEG